ncbi:hypothetical protein LCGC14_2646670, partial [marine sediment metagenome]
TIISLLKPAEKASKLAKKLGIEFSAAALRSKGLGEMLLEVGKATKGDIEVIAQLFPNVRALNTVLSLTVAQADEYTRQMKIMEDVTGATNKAFQEIDRTIQQRLKKAYASMSASGKSGKATLRFAEGDDDVEKVWNKIESIWSGAGELLKPAIEMIRKAAAGDWAAAWKDMKDHARLALDTVLNILEEYLPKFADYGLALLSEIIDGLSAEGKGGKSILSRVTQLMVKIIAKLLEWVVKNVHKITPIGVEIGKGIAKGIWEALKGVPGEIVKRLGKAARGAVRRAAEEVTGDTGVTGEPEAGAAIPTGRPRQRVNPTTGELEDRPTGPTTQTTINITQPQSSQDINAAMTREILRGRI